MHSHNREQVFADRAKLIARLGFGGLMIPHGYSKLMKLFAPGDISFADPIWLGPDISLYLTIFAELICAVLLIVGFKTRWVVIPPIITMMVAAFIVHGDDPWGKKEFALLYLVGYMIIMLLGPGRYSLDHYLNSRKR